MILLFAVVGWGPVFFADLLGSLGLHASSEALGFFAMDWLMVTLYCTLLAMAFAIGHAVRLMVDAVRHSAQGRGPGAGGSEG
jgi:hypothetical protein